MSRYDQDQDFGNLAGKNLSLADFEGMDELDTFEATRADEGRKQLRRAIKHDKMERQGRLPGGGRRTE